jgi:two-component system, NtrC family, nitrogen regulation sensor histidine kinase NtrY
MANTFAREIYHEVIKLLSPIAMSVERFHEKVSREDSGVPELAKETARIGHRLGHLRAVLDSMRAYTDQPRLMFGVHSLGEVVDEAVSLVRESEQKNRPRPAIVVTGEADVALSLARDRFIQALTNVLFNAIEAYDGKSPPHAPVEVTYRFKNDHIELSITDFGCGMSEEVLKDAPVLFATSKAEGTGFGLPLAIKIIESEHGGRLTIESAKGRGTTVHILLPPSSQQSQQRATR